jgi:hypothetical protein
VAAAAHREGQPIGANPIEDGGHGLHRYAANNTRRK